MSSLHYASCNGHEDVVKFLLATEDLDVNKVDDKGNTPLILASQEGHISIIRTLLQNGANVNHKSKSGYVAFVVEHMDLPIDFKINVH